MRHSAPRSISVPVSPGQPKTDGLLPLGRNPRTLTTTLTLPPGPTFEVCSPGATSTGVLLRNDGLDAEVSGLAVTGVFALLKVDLGAPAGAMSDRMSIQFCNVKR